MRSAQYIPALTLHIHMSFARLAWYVKRVRNHTSEPDSRFTSRKFPVIYTSAPRAATSDKKSSKQQKFHMRLEILTREDEIREDILLTMPFKLEEEVLPEALLEEGAEEVGPC